MVISSLAILFCNRSDQRLSPPSQTDAILKVSVLVLIAHHQHLVSISVSNLRADVRKLRSKSFSKVSNS